MAKQKPENLITDFIGLPLSTGLTPTVALAQFVFACVTMGGFMFTHGLNIDEELGLFTSLSISSQGRFSLELLGQILQPPGILPLAPYVMLAIAYIGAYTIILSLHGLRHTWKSQLGFLIFILFPINWLNQEWSSLAAGLALGLACTTTAAWLTIKTIDYQLPPLGRQTISILIVILLVLALSTFQSQITLYLAIGLGIVLFSISKHQSEGSKNKWTYLRAWTVHALAALGAYAITVKAFLAFTNQNIQHVNVYFKSPYYMLRTEPIKYILGNVEQFLRTYLTPDMFFGHALYGLPLIVGGSLILYFCQSKPSRLQLQSAGINLKTGWPAIIAWIALLAVPMALNIISKPYRIPMRAMFAVPYVAWFSTMIWLEISTKLKRPKTLAFGGLLACLLILQSMITISHYYAARAYNQRSDQLVASTIAAAIAAGSNQGPEVDQLITQGSLDREQPYRTGWYSFAGASFFGWDSGINARARISAWLRAMGIAGLNPVAKGDENRFDSQFQTMKAWPQPGSIKVVDQTVLIKLNEKK